MSLSTQVNIYTDGSSRGNPGPGGYGIILQSGPHYKEFSEGFRLTTNNRMELLSVIRALETLKTSCEVTVYSDSKYVVDSVEKNWIAGWVKRGWKNVKNPDLWKRYLNAAARHRVQFRWIRGHNGHPMNERCDFLATTAATGPELHPDEWYELYGQDQGMFKD
jgi:ribonuclease HI